MGRDHIKFGWNMCCVSLFNVYNAEELRLAMIEHGRQELVVEGHVPEKNEIAQGRDQELESDSEDEGKDVLDVMKKRREGTRKSTRRKARVKKFGGGVNPSQIDMVESGEDSDANGM